MDTELLCNYLFELIYLHNKIENSLDKQLENEHIEKMSVHLDNDGEIQYITYQKENDPHIRQKFLVDDKVLEPLGLNIHNLIYLSLEKSGANIRHSVLEQFQHNT